MIRSAILGMWLCFFTAPFAASACTCSQAPPGKCPVFQQGDVVFLGTVTAIENASSPAINSDAPPNSSADTNGAGASADATPVTRYHFRIDEKFAGPDTPEIDVFSGGDDGDCGYRFNKGQQYVVFTQQENAGLLFATTCNGTRPAGDARTLLPQLRAMRNGERVASVFGVLRRANPPFLAPAGGPDDPLPRISLRLRSRDDRFQTTTDADGVYSFYDVHAGEYSFTADLRARMELTRKTLPGGLPPFKIPNGACYEYDVDALPTGHIRGSVLGPDGRPLQLASLELYRAGQYSGSLPGLWGFQGAKGVFDFDHIGPGEYVLVFNRTNRVDPNSPFPRSFYPGTTDVTQAAPIALKDGQQLLNLKMKLTEGYPTRQVRVRLKWQSGRPPGAVTVMAKDGQGDNPAVHKIAGGLYQFTLLESTSYTISAWEDLAPQRAASRRSTGCAVPARIETAPVVVSGTDATAKDVMLTFPATACE